MVAGVADLADEDDVRRLPHGVLECRLVGEGVDAHLALVDDGLLVLVGKFDGVLDGEDVAPAGAVAVIDHGRQGAGLARSGGPDHQEKSPLDADEFRQHRGQRELREGRNAVLDIADHHRRSAALAEDIDPEAPNPLQLHPQVALPGLGQLSLLALVHHGVGQGQDLLAAQDPVAKGQEGPIHLQMRPRALAEKEVGTLLGGHDFEKGVQVHALFQSRRGNGVGMCREAGGCVKPRDGLQGR
jgi:hypothetical protein